MPTLLLILHMAGWGISLRMLRRFIPVRRLVWLAIPIRTCSNYTLKDVMRAVQLLDYLRLWAREGDCLVRSLVCHRFLLLCGAEPTLVIGFNGEKGHSWIELCGKPVLEMKAPVLYR
ncbi:MAG: lasso peptide biosynthesis B2 protein, partial [Omnitrophica WOR_2 bacterium]